MFNSRRNHWAFFRKSAWLAIAWNVGMLLLLFAATGVTGTVNGDAASSASAASSQIARGLLMVPLFFVWFVGFLVTGFIWLGTRPRSL